MGLRYVALSPAWCLDFSGMRNLIRPKDRRNKTNASETHALMVPIRKIFQNRQSSSQVSTIPTTFIIPF